MMRGRGAAYGSPLLRVSISGGVVDRGAGGGCTTEGWRPVMPGMLGPQLPDRLTLNCGGAPVPGL